MESIKNSFGTTDLPVLDLRNDRFGIASYVESLSEFICNCDTPMTIAIQGDWGSGKTSMMNMIEKNLGDSVCSIKFNTWQYSQFSIGDQLSITLMNKLLKTLSHNSEEVNKTMAMVWNFSKRVITSSVKNATGGIVDLQDVAEAQKELDYVEELVTLKKAFEDAVKAKANETPANRVVVFIDDLDRLQPEKAVEMLEVIKIFLDCENCVFVLAIDYAVVSQGIKKKFGDSVSDEKGKSFFDKIIQLPFKMPVGHYNIDGYLQELLSRIWGDITEDEKSDINHYIEVIDSTIGKNPRSIKRTVNAFSLINSVAEKKETYGNDPEIKKNKQKLLFVLLCIQLAYEELYIYLLENIDGMDDSFIQGLRDDETFKNTLRVIFKKKEIEKDFFERVDRIIEIFSDWCYDLIDKKANEDVKYNAIKEVFQFSSITSSNTIKRNSATYCGLNEIVEKVKTNQEVVNIYKHLESKIISKFNNVSIKGTLGQNSMVYYVESGERSRRFLEVNLNKTSLTICPMKYGDESEIIEMENIMNTNCKRISHNMYHITGVTSIELADKSLDFIEKSYNFIVAKYCKGKV